MKHRSSRRLILAVLSDVKPKSSREIQKATGLSGSAVNDSPLLCWNRGLVLRTKKLLYEHERIFKSRSGVSQTARPYHLYLLNKPEAAGHQRGYKEN